MSQVYLDSLEKKIMSKIPVIAFIVTLIMIIFLGVAKASSLEITVFLTSETGLGQEIGIIRANDTSRGLVLNPELKGLTPGKHGFHVHQNPSCNPATNNNGKVVPGLAAGGHFDPEKTASHQGPFGDGHLGDLPRLFVDEAGNAILPVLAPRLKVADLRNRSLIIHLKGDNYSDDPLPLGGGGPREACGVIN